MSALTSARRARGVGNHGCEASRSLLLPGKAKAFPVAELEAAKAWLAESGN